METSTIGRIFVVEDEAVISMDICERLAALGYGVCGSASRGEAAVEKIIQYKPDLVLMDINLAGAIDGVETARRIRKRHDAAIVFLSAYSTPELIKRVSDTGCYGFLVKPFEEREVHTTLQVALARHLDKRALQRQAIIDPLTGLHNRRFLDEMLLIEFGRARREEMTFSVAMIDIDHFKHLNDTHGHAAGDHALRQVATQIRGAVRANDIVCRYGGEEFAVVMPGTTAASAAHKIKLVCKSIREMNVEYAGNHLPLTVSAGVAEMPATGSSPELLLRMADAALYRAKREGRDRWIMANTLLETV